MVGLPSRCGLGLKPQHFQQVLAALPAVAFFEVHAENYMGEGGPLHHFLARIREQYPLSLHGVGLSLAGEAPLDEAHLQRLARLVRRYRPAAFSEHLAWSSHGGVFLNDLLPVPYEERTLQRVGARVQHVQERLACRLLVENPSTYVGFTTSTLDEADFLRELVQRTGCGLLLDVSNVHVSSVNHGTDALAYLDALPLEAVGEIHLAGCARDRDAAGAELLVDHHGSPVDEAVWPLYRHVVGRCGSRPTLIEWDNEVPAFEVLLAQAARAQAELRRARLQPEWLVEQAA